MIKLIGLDNALLEKVSSKERYFYRLVAFTFLLVIILSIVSNAYFGWMMSASWLGVVLFGLILGFIHFSILRIALITMITLPLVNASIHNQNSKPLKSFKNQFTLTGFFRWLFILCIAVTMAFSLVSLMLHKTSARLNYEKRMEVYNGALQQYKNADCVPLNLKQNLLTANYPFYVFRFWLSKTWYCLLIALFIVIVAVPFFIILWIKRNKNFQYEQNVLDSFIVAIKSDYAMTLEESQWILEQRFPWFNKTLNQVNLYEDAPFNTKLKYAKNRQWGNEADWLKWKNSLQ